MPWYAVPCHAMTKAQAFAKCSISCSSNCSRVGGQTRNSYIYTYRYCIDFSLYIHTHVYIIHCPRGLGGRAGTVRATAAAVGLGPSVGPARRGRPHREDQPLPWGLGPPAQGPRGAASTESPSYYELAKFTEKVQFRETLGIQDLTGN